MRLPLPRLWRHPFHGSPERKSSGIPVAVVCDHGAVVSTGFPSPDAGWGSLPLRQRGLQAHVTRSVRVLGEPRWGARSEE